MLDLAAIYERHATQLWRYAYGKLRDADDAHDIVQQTFLKAVEASERYEERGYPVRAWLYRIAEHRIIDLLRQRRRRPTVALWEDSALVDPPAEPPDLDLSALSERHRYVLWLYALGHTQYSGASLLGTTPGAYKAVLNRARAKAREVVGYER